MPVAVVMDFKDATLDQYDQVIVKMGFTPGGAGSTRCSLPLGGRERGRNAGGRRVGDP